eukprot:1111639-Amorphochlora_amoeboformis.AAC.2
MNESKEGGEWDGDKERGRGCEGKERQWRESKRLKEINSLLRSQVERGRKVKRETPSFLPKA